MIFDCENESKGVYSLLIGAVVPRPIAWVSTCSASGQTNLAPFSFFNVFAVNPPILGFSPGLKQKAGSSELIMKDTLRNVIDTEEFVVNLVCAALTKQMVQSSADYSADESEFDATGLATAPSLKIKAPRVADAPISMECKLHQIIELGTSSLVLGRVVNIHVKDEIMTGNSIDVEKFEPVARLGGELYATLAKPFTMERPQV